MPARATPQGVAVGHKDEKGVSGAVPADVFGGGNHGIDLGHSQIFT